ncbi:hypothetical protein Nepgr_021245 [Nepenthes gracilis]|uniref:Reverse transcriptase RNase H-like domain-containing protein n=1 Tax=Nepenthes gracilis TaxID=150966 RepID=A0AAD3SYC6_NEPGR|nr:hypothetical protein Nepgr_021245 [Nepenthes gracilis]
MALALTFAARKLRPYFQAHRVVVLTDRPLKGILQKPDVSGRLVKWAIELGEFDIEFRPRPAIKAQALADFIVETTTPIQEEQPVENEEQPGGAPEWTLHVDGSSTDSGNGAGVILTTLDGFEINALAKAKETIQGFDKLTLVHIPRAENWKADRLARAAATENP